MTDMCVSDTRDWQGNHAIFRLLTNNRAIPRFGTFVAHLGLPYKKLICSIFKSLLPINCFPNAVGTSFDQLVLADEI